MIGAILAGGAGRRLVGGGAGEPFSKPAFELAGRPLLSYPLAALAEVCDRVAVVCKRGTILPTIGEAERWDEPDEPRHPLTGIVRALERAGEPVLVCGADMPFVTAAGCRALIATAETQGAPIGASPTTGRAALAVLAVTGPGLEPLFGIYAPGALDLLTSAPADAPLRATVAALDPVRVPMRAATLSSVNTPEDLAAATARLGAPRATPRARAGDSRAGTG